MLWRADGAPLLGERSYRQMEIGVRSLIIASSPSSSA
jgi:hypothetical protein